MAAIVEDQVALAPGVRLIGEMDGSGYAHSQFLAERDGSVVLLSELLYRVAEQAERPRSVEQIASGVTDATRWHLTPGDVHRVLETKLRPLGLVGSPDAPQ